MFSIDRTRAYIDKQLGAVRDTSPLTREEKKAAIKIISLLKSLAEGAEVDISEEEELEEGPEDVDSDPEWTGDIDEDGEAVPAMQSPGTLVFGDIVITAEQAKEALEYRWLKNGTKRPRAAVANRYKWLKHTRHWTQLMEYGKNEEIKKNRKSSLLVLKKELAEVVHAKIDAGIPLQDRDIRALATAINRRLSLFPRFTASASWINAWKRANRLGSRRITRIVARKTLVDEEKVLEEVDNLRKDFKDDWGTVNPALICNADQSGVNKELAPKRTISRKNEKETTRVVQSVAATTHSYTVMPIIFMDGTVAPALYVVLAEPTGKFPAKGVFDTFNLVVTCGKSHIMTKAMMVDWMKRCLFDSSFPADIHFIHDSWTCFRDDDTIKATVPPMRTLQRKRIPPHGTRHVQPLDVGYFYHFKAVLKYISAHVTLHYPNWQLSKRDNILKVLSLVHRIFTHPNYRPLVLYAWFKAGLLDTRPPPYTTPLEECFKLTTSPCFYPGCPNDVPFVSCPPLFPSHVLHALCRLLSQMLIECCFTMQVDMLIMLSLIYYSW